MEFIENAATLEALYGAPPDAALQKVATCLAPTYRGWIMASRLCILTTVGPDGTDGSPRGDDGPVVAELDPQTLAMPDWRGNNRLDSLRNIVTDGRVSLMFLVPGSNNVVRVNGTARLTAEYGLRARFAKKRQLPTTVIVVRIGEIYSQCARALLRSRTWSGEDESGTLPTIGDILSERTEGAVNGQEYDTGWGPRATKSLW